MIRTHLIAVALLSLLRNREAELEANLLMGKTSNHCL